MMKIKNYEIRDEYNKFDLDGIKKVHILYCLIKQVVI